MLIKIDRNSIKLNPNPPLYVFNSGERTSWTFKVAVLNYSYEQIEKDLSLQEFNSHIIRYNMKFEFNEFCSFECEGVSESYKDAQNLYKHLSNEHKFKVFDFNFNIKIDRKMQFTESLFNQKWLYKYEKTILTCQHCSHEMQYYDLLQDKISYFDEFGEEIYYTDVCPKCHTNNCCVYEFENINFIEKELLKD